MPCADISRDVLAAVAMVLLIGLNLSEQKHLLVFVKAPQTGMFEAWMFREPGAAALHAVGKLFGQFPRSAAKCHQHVYLRKERWAYRIEVEGNNDCTDIA